MQPQISQYRLLVKDFAASFRFYRDVMGLPVGSGSEEDVYGAFVLGENLTLGLFRRDFMAEAVGTKAKPIQAEMQDAVVLAFEVENVDAAVDVLTQRGVTLIASLTDRPDWGMRTAHFRDPDGNLLEIFHSIPMHE